MLRFAKAHFGEMDYDEYSSWSAGMSLHENLRATEEPTAIDFHIDPSGPANYLATYPELSPLGDERKIRNFIQGRLHAIEDWRGALPFINEVPVPGLDQPLQVPSEGLPRRVYESIDRTIALGIDGLEDLLEEIDETLRSGGVGLADFEITTIRGRAVMIDRRDRGDVVAVELVNREETLPDGTTRMVQDLGQRVDPVTGARVSGWGEVERGSTLSRLQDGVRQAQSYATLLTSIVSAAQAVSSASSSFEKARAAIGLAGVVCDVLATVANTLSAIGSISAAMSIVGVVFIALGALCAIIGWILEAVYAEYGPEGRVEDVGYKNNWRSNALAMVALEKLRIACQCEDAALTQENLFNLFVEEGEGEETRDFYRGINMILSTQPLVRYPDDFRERAALICQTLGGNAEAWNKCLDIKNWLLYVGMDPLEADVVYYWLLEAHKVTVVRERQHFLVTEGRRGLDVNGGCEDCDYIGTRYVREWGTPRWYERSKNLPLSAQREFDLAAVRSVHEWLRAIVIRSRPPAGAPGGPPAIIDPTAWRLIESRKAKWLDPTVAPTKSFYLGELYVEASRELTADLVRPLWRKNYISVGFGSNRWGCLVASAAGIRRYGTTGRMAPAAWTLSPQEESVMRSSGFQSKLGSRLNGASTGTKVAVGLGAAALVGLAIWKLR